MEDKRAYVQWIAYVMGFYSEGEEKKYERNFKNVAKKHGMSREDIDLLLMKSFKDDFSKAIDNEVFNGADLEKSEPDIDFALLSDEEKYNFLLEKGHESSILLELYVFELAKNQEFEKLKNFIAN
jgi:hypothetical protein